MSKNYGNKQFTAANQIASYVDDTGVADAYVVSIRPIALSYTEGLLIHFLALNASTGPSTLDVDGLGPRPIKKSVTADIGEGDILAGEIVTVIYDGVNFQLLGSKGLLPENELVYGGIVTWISGYTYNVSAAGYYINHVFYTSPSTDVILSPADGTYDRIDVFSVNTSSAVEVIEGDPAVIPLEPSVDPELQLRLTAALVQTGTTDPGVGGECIYLEDTEWTTTESTVRISSASLTNPCAGVRSVEGTAVINGDNILFTRPGGLFNPWPSLTVLRFYIRSKGNWGNKKLTIRFTSGGAPVGQPVTFGHGSYGFNSGDIVNCQIISIPLSDLIILPSTTVDGLRITASIQGGGNFGFWIDQICLQDIPIPAGGNGTSGTSGTTGTSGTSATGADGTSGTSGIDGVAGTSGTSAAASGTSGTHGTSGSSGTSAATSGTSGNGSSGTSGTSGATGVSGSSGTSGAVGVAGTSGTSGVDGATGDAGDDGTSGSSGTSGAVGVAGTSGTSATGAAGTSGTSGSSGLDGATTGTSGTSGSAGTSGTSAATSGTSGSGTSGTSGATGPAGTSGSSGTSGVNGGDGTSGTSGVNGAAGAQGPNGTHGTSGTTGTSGTSGINGTSGLSGTAGTSGSSGSSGADGVDGTVYSVENGLHTKAVHDASSTNVFHLGGDLIEITTIDTKVPYYLNVTGTFEDGSISGIFRVSNTKTTNLTTGILGTVASSHPSSVAIAGSAISGVGVQGSSSNIGVLGNGSNYGVQGLGGSTGIGVYGSSGSNAAGFFQVAPTSTNTIVTSTKLIRFSTGSAANGIGVALEFLNEASDSGAYESGRIASTWTDVSVGGRTGDLQFFTTTSTSSTRKARVIGTGQWTWDMYGDGTFEDTYTYLLGTKADGTIVEVDASGFGGGGGLTADNGLTENVTDNVQLGGTLLQNTSIATTASYYLEVTGSSTASNTMRVRNTSTGDALLVTASDGSAINASVSSTGTTILAGSNGGIAVFGSTTSSTALYGLVTSGTGVQGQATSGLPIKGFLFSSGTTDVGTILNLERGTSGTADVGMGAALNFTLQGSTGVAHNASRLITKWTDAAVLTRTAQIELWSVNNATLAKKASLSGSGQWTWDQYGDGTFEDTYTYLIGAKADGTIVEVDASGFGGGSVTADNGLTMSIATNVQLGATASGSNSPLLHKTYINTTSSFSLEVNGSNTSRNAASGGIFMVVNTAQGFAQRIDSQAEALYINADQSGVGYNAVHINFGAGQGLNVLGTSGNGLLASVTTGKGAVLIANPATTNTTHAVLDLNRQTSGTAATGIGGSIDMKLDDDANSNGTANQIVWKYSDAATASRTSQLEIWCTNNTSTAKKFTVYGNGDVELEATGAGIIMKSPDGTRYKATFANGGTWNIATA